MWSQARSQGGVGGGGVGRPPPSCPSPRFCSTLGMWMTSHGQCPRGGWGACECPRGVSFNFSEGGWRHADNVQGGCLWMSKSGGVFQIDDIQVQTHPSKFRPPPTWLAGYGPVRRLSFLTEAQLLYMYVDYSSKNGKMVVLVDLFTRLEFVIWENVVWIVVTVWATCSGTPNSHPACATHLRTPNQPRHNITLNPPPTWRLLPDGLHSGSAGVTAGDGNHRPPTTRSPNPCPLRMAI